MTTYIVRRILYYIMYRTSYTGTSYRGLCDVSQSVDVLIYEYFEYSLLYSVDTSFNIATTLAHMYIMLLFVLRLLFIYNIRAISDIT